MAEFCEKYMTFLSENFCIFTVVFVIGIVLCVGYLKKSGILTELVYALKNSIENIKPLVIGIVGGILISSILLAVLK